MEQITEAVKPVKSLKALKNDKGKISVTYVGENNPDSILKAEDLFTTAALARKIELQGYKRVEIDNSIRTPLMVTLFGKTELTPAEAAEIRKTTLFFNNIVKELSIIETPKAELTPFQKEKQAAYAKKMNVKNGKNNSITLEQAQAELEAVYAKYDEPYKPKVRKAVKK